MKLKHLSYKSCFGDMLFDFEMTVENILNGFKRILTNDNDEHIVAVLDNAAANDLTENK